MDAKTMSSLLSQVNGDMEVYMNVDNNDGTEDFIPVGSVKLVYLKMSDKYAVAVS